MDSRINPDRETFRSLLRRIPYRNQATEDAPPFAVLEMGPATLAPDGSWCLTGSKPASGVRAAMVAANSSLRCDVDAVGELTVDAPVVFRVSGATVNAGDGIGPVADSWDMQKGVGSGGWLAIAGEEMRQGVRTALAIPMFRDDTFVCYEGPLTSQLTDPSDDAAVTPVTCLSTDLDIVAATGGTITAKNKCGGVGDAGRKVLVWWNRSTDIHYLTNVEHVLFEPLVGIEIDMANSVVKGHQKFISVMTWTQTAPNYITIEQTTTDCNEV